MGAVDLSRMEPVFLHGAGAPSIFTQDDPARVFPFYRWTKIVQGAGEYRAGGVCCAVRAGDYLLLQPGERFIRVPQRMEIFYVSFTLNEGRKVVSAIAQLPRVCRFDGTATQNACVAAAFEDLRVLLRSGTLAYRAHLQARVLLSLFAQMQESSQPQAHIPLHVREVAELIAAQPTARLSVPALAGKACVSASQLRRLFARYYGCSPLQYQIRARIESACHLLAVEHLSVQETALRLGYPDAFTFSRQFRDLRGYPPRQHAARGGET